MTRGVLKGLLMLWVFVGLVPCLVSLWHLPPPDLSRQPRSLDADNIVATREPAGVRGMPMEETAGEAPAFLQACVLQIAADGLDEALLVADQVPLQRGVQQRLELQFGQDDASQRKSVVKQFAGVQYRAERQAELPESFGQQMRRFTLDYVWRGESSLGHLLEVLDDGIVHAERRPGFSGHGSGGICMTSVVLQRGQPWLFAQLHRGNVLIFRLVDQQAPAEDLSTIEFWHRACRTLVAAEPRDTNAAPQLGALVGERVQRPVLLADPFESLCLASLLFRDQELATAALAKRDHYEELPYGLWPEDRSGFYTDVWRYQRMAAVPTLLGDGSVMPWSVGEFDYAHAIAVRCLLLQNDAAIADAMAAQLLPRMHTNNLYLLLLRHSDLTVAPVVSAAWERLHDAAIRGLGLPWNLALAGPVNLVIYLLLPLLLGVVVATGKERSRPRLPLGAGRLLLMFLAAFLTLGNVALRPLFALLFAFAAAVDVRSSPSRGILARVLVVLAVAAVMVNATLDTRFEVRFLPLRMFAQAGSLLAWILIGWRLVEDGGWRSLGC